MKKMIVTVLAFLFLGMTATELNAQRVWMKKADRLYSMKAYAEAIPFYERALQKNNSIPTALIRVADCYRLTNNSKQAMTYYARVVKLPSVEPIHLYHYAQALMQNGYYEDAKKYMREYKDDERGKAFEKAIARLSVFYKDTSLYLVRPASFNSEQNDFCPVFLTDDKVVFISARDKTQWVSYTHSWTDRKYYMLYVVEKDYSEQFAKPKLFARNLQIRFNDGPICFDKDGTTIYTTRNNFLKNKVVKSSSGEVKLNLYRAELDENKRQFVNLRGFDFNSKEYNTAHPAISPDGRRLYFSSDMPGTHGGMDLWVCYKEGDDWGNPVNMGEKVNTSGDDVFPYILDDKSMYFSSNGHEGIGGLDLFSVKLKGNGMPEESPVNMGVPMNSSADDFGIAFHSNGKKGFFSSNRKSYDLDDDIYEFYINPPKTQPYRIIVKDSVSGQLLASTLVILDDVTAQRDELNESGGDYTTDLLPQHEYTLAATSEGYIPKSNINYTTPVEAGDPYEILLSPVPKYFIRGTVYQIFDDSTSKPLENATVVIKDAEGNIVCTTYTTDASGKYHSCDLKPNTKYIVTASKDGFFAKSSEVPSIPPGGAIRDFFLSQIVIGKAIKIENIYFDLDKSYIRPDAAVELDKIVKLMQENPEIIIELGSHTDCRASYKYNMDLSDRRAKSSAAYIVSKGIDQNRISGKGYGESQLVNDCRCEGAVKSDCSEEEHQMNRRTEFKVTGFVKGMGNVNIKSTE